jgi:hypothetical protein
MASVEKSFKELLEAAPPAKEDLYSLTGTLARAADPEKFVLTLADGRAVTLDIDAVKSHKVIAAAAGHTIVSIEVDPKQLPAETLSGAGGAPDYLSGAGTGAIDVPITGLADHPGTIYAFVDLPHSPLAYDVHLKQPFGDTAPGFADFNNHYAAAPARPEAKHPYRDFGTNPYSDSANTPVGLDLHFRGDPYAVGVPFGLATPHQSAEAAAMAAQAVNMQAMSLAHGGRWKFFQDGGKMPEQDLTTPPHLDI